VHKAQWHRQVCATLVFYAKQQQPPVLHLHHINNVPTPLIQFFMRLCAIQPSQGIQINQSQNVYRQVLLKESAGNGKVFHAFAEKSIELRLRLLSLCWLGLYFGHEELFDGQFD
jgi:hypothetical protein